MVGTPNIINYFQLFNVINYFQIVACVIKLKHQFLCKIELLIIFYWICEFQLIEVMSRNLNLPKYD